MILPIMVNNKDTLRSWLRLWTCRVPFYAMISGLLNTIYIKIPYNYGTLAVNNITLIVKLVLTRVTFHIHARCMYSGTTTKTPAKTLHLKQ